MKLLTSIFYHAKYEPDPSSGLAVIALKNLTYSFNVTFQNSRALTLIKAINLGVKEILDVMCTTLFSTI